MTPQALFFALQGQIGCPDGYTLSVDETICTKIDTVAAYPPSGTLGIVDKVQSNQWNLAGARIYQLGYTPGGNGTVLATMQQPGLWVNGDSPSTQVQGHNGSNFEDGRMNVNGIWVKGLHNPGTTWGPVDEWIGFTKKVVATVAKVYYVGISGDNVFKINVNGQPVVDTTNSVGIAFDWWEIYPVSLNSGTNYIEMFVKNANNPAFPDNPGGFACEIYDMTAAQLIAVTDQSQLKTIFRTLDMVGLNWDLGETIGYSCDPGWALENNGGQYSCKLISTVAPE